MAHPISLTISIFVKLNMRALKISTDSNQKRAIQRNCKNRLKNDSCADYNALRVSAPICCNKHKTKEIQRIEYTL